LDKAAIAAEQGALATLTMKASAGRASYVETSQLKYPDPGAHAIGVILRAMNTSICTSAKTIPPIGTL